MSFRPNSHTPHQAKPNGQRAEHRANAFKGTHVPRAATIHWQPPKTRDMKALQELARKNIWQISPDETSLDNPGKDDARIFLDANEIPYNKPHNRYPDPWQTKLKATLSQVKGVAPENIFLGNGSDEVIDMVYRVFCEPRRDNVVAIAPTYGTYKARADVNDVEYRAVPLSEGFRLDAQKTLAARDANTKVIWLCSPNDPTGNSLQQTEIEKIIMGFDGIVVIDEAYSDFSPAKLFRSEIGKHPNIIALNTMSKAWGRADIRLGMAFANEQIVKLLNKVKLPYNINTLTQRHALDALEHRQDVEKWVRMLLQERGQLMKAFEYLPICERVYPSDSNFFLAKMTDARSIYKYLTEKGIAVKNESDVELCENCLRVTVGTKSENSELLGALRQF